MEERIIALNVVQIVTDRLRIKLVFGERTIYLYMDLTAVCAGLRAFLLYNLTYIKRTFAILHEGQIENKTIFKIITKILPINIFKFKAKILILKIYGQFIT
ncbi:hypothetical protein ACJX0J_009897 [Zea mays]